MRVAQLLGRLPILVLLTMLACAAPAAAPSPSAAPTAPAAAAPAAAPTQAATSPPAMEPLRTGYTTTSASLAGVWMAKEGGYFAQNGIDADLGFVRAGAEVLAAVSSREMPIAIGGGVEFIGAALEGSDHVMLGGMATKLAVSLYVTPEITSVAGLKDKAIGVSRFGAITHFGAQKILARNNLREGADVAVIQTGGVPESLAAMQSGAVQGAILTPPITLKARQLGFQQLVDTKTLDIPSQGSVIGSTRSYVREHPDLVDRYLKSLIEGIHRLITDREFGMTVIGRYTQTDDREVLADAYDYYRDGYQRDLMPTLEGLQEQIDELADAKPQARNAKPQDFLDLAPLERVKATGLVDRLYAQ
ncbi:MAG TPA: ABC transporter substrate-binding protein [Chloroflexota bacterium]|nr:ABC transporter substrate-binding protein [Chloroflexota bacterium]